MQPDHQRRFTVQVKTFKMSLFLLLLLHCTAVAEEFHYIAARDGHEVTLPCRLEADVKKNCRRVTWLLSKFNNVPVVELTEWKDGKIQTKSDRQNVTADCSLVMKVRVEDVGQYTCRRVSSSGEVKDATVVLSVVTMTKPDSATVDCSLEGRTTCDYSVQWLCDFNGDGVDDEATDSSQSRCSASKHHTKLKSGDFCRCKVTNLRTKKALTFSFGPQPTGEGPGERPGEGPDATTATTVTVRTTETSSEEGSTTAGPGPGLPDLWLYLIVAVGLVLLLIMAVVVFTWKRMKRSKTKMDDNTRGQKNLNDTDKESDTDTSHHQATVEPDNGVTLVYASVSYTKNTNSKHQTPVKSDDDEGDTVTYSTVKTSSSTTRASDDPSNLYATVFKSDR